VKSNIARYLRRSGKKKKYPCDNPKWRYLLQILKMVFGVFTVVAGVAAAVALFKSISLEKELSRRPFVSLSFFHYDRESGRYDYRFSEFSSLSDITNETSFFLILVNTGTKFSRSGKVTIAFPRWLDVSVAGLIGEARLAPEKELMFADSKVFELEYGRFISPVEYNQQHGTKNDASLKGLAIIKIKMPDTTLGREFRIGEAYRWPIVYQIEDNSEEEIYLQRWLWVYLGLQDSAIMDSFIRFDREANLYEKKYRPDVEITIQKVIAKPN
jgi:hypothetical protein